MGVTPAVLAVDAGNSKTGPGQGEPVTFSEGMKINLPAHSVVSIQQN